MKEPAARDDAARYDRGEYTGVDIEHPSAARVYDYYLGGAHNFAVDRQMADEAIAQWPDLPRIMRLNRAFLRRAVQYCLQAGIRQFLDLGSGIPTAGNVHEVVRATAPEARVVYVDNDPVAVAHSRNLLRDHTNTAVVDADLRRPSALLRDPSVTEMLDLTQPVAVLMVAVLHFVEDADEPTGLIAAYRDSIVDGSYVIVSHASHEGRPDQADSHQDLYNRTSTPMTMRSREAITGMLSGLELVEPGLVYLPSWRPDPGEDVDAPEHVPGLAAVGRKVS